MFCESYRIIMNTGFITNNKLKTSKKNIYTLE